MIILENKWCCVASIPQRNQLREVCSINIMLRFSSAFLYRPSERIYNEASWDQDTSLEFKAFQFLCNNKNNLLSQLSGRFLDIPQHGMQHLKYCWSRLLPSNELTYQINVTENESIPRRWEWWTRCQATNLWRSLALQLIHFTPVVTFAQHDMA